MKAISYSLSYSNAIFQVVTEEIRGTIIRRVGMSIAEKRKVEEK